MAAALRIAMIEVLGTVMAIQRDNQDRDGDDDADEYSLDDARAWMLLAEAATAGDEDDEDDDTHIDIP